MNVIPTGFDDFLARHKILWAVVSTAPYQEKMEFGEPAGLESADIVEQYFEDLQALDRSLEGRTLPNMVQQGIVAGVICKPTETVLVGVLYHDDRDAVQRYHHSKKLDYELRMLWAA